MTRSQLSAQGSWKGLDPPYSLPQETTFLEEKSMFFEWLPFLVLDAHVLL